MKCYNCNSEWTVPQNISNTLSACPFCGKSLYAPSETAVKIEDALRAIIDRFGLDVLSNGQRTIALFSDLYPSMARDRRLLSYLIQANGHEKLIAIRKSCLTDQQTCLLQVRKYMIDEQFISEDAASHICISFAMAIGLNATFEKPNTPIAPSPYAATSSLQRNTPQESLPQKTNTLPVQSPPQGAPSVKAVQKPSNSTKIDTFAKYQKALEDYYLIMGKKPLTTVQIQAFLSMHSLGQVWGVTISDVQQDLKAIYAKYNTPQRDASRQKASTPSVQPPQNVVSSVTSAQVSSNSIKIDTFAKYQKALEDYFLTTGKKPLTTVQIQSFLSKHSLDRVWGVTISDVQQDLNGIYAKYSMPQHSAPPPTPQINRPQIATQRRSQIHTYADYLTELEHAYCSNGKAKLSREQVISFIQSFQLGKRYGITVSEVQKDLEDIYAKHITPHPSIVPVDSPISTTSSQTQIHSYDSYLSELELAYIKNGKLILSRRAIVCFIQTHDLGSRLGITVSDVQKDLLRIAQKHK